MKILVTGGAGYIGSHTVLELLNAGHEVVVMDNLSNSSETSLQRVAELAGRAPEFHNVDLLDLAGMKELFTSTQPDAVIHFAGLKAVGESAEKPLWYYQTNVAGTLNLLYAMEEANCRSIVFSSSATVYGEPESMPLVEKLNMDAQSILRICSWTWRPPMTAGILRCCVISTPWARTSLGVSVRTRQESRITWCRLLPRWRWAAAST